MKRAQLFEFEDFNWFPSWLRICITNLLVVLHRIMGISDVLADLIAHILRDKKISQIVDLGSGSGGAMPEVLKKIHQNRGLENVELVMTDLYPHPKILKKFNTHKTDNISYLETSVDATEIAAAPAGLKTMVNSFHHMPPEEARKILESAKMNGQPLLIYEMAENGMPILIWWILLPISMMVLMVMALLMTPFVRPMTWQQLLFTYLIPIIPICYAWDGQASMPRIYAFKDLEILLEGLRSQDYTWEKGHVKKKNGKKMGMYLLGLPSESHIGL